MTTKEINEITKAVLEGKPIQVKNNGAWETIYGEPNWHFNHCDYRIKPEPKLRPYANAEEFLQAQKEHGLYINLSFYVGEENYYVCPISIDSEGIWYYDTDKDAGMYIEYSMFTEEKATWQDGTPCGIIEEE